TLIRHVHVSLSTFLLNTEHLLSTMNHLANHLDSIAGKRLLVLGDLMLDRYVWGDAERISREAPVMVLRESLDEVRPGGGANVASFLRGLDAHVMLAGMVGDDAEGRTLLRLME